MKYHLIVASACGVIAATSCQVASPEDQSIQPAIVLSLAPEFAEVVQDVYDARIRITPPSGTRRDTVLIPRGSDGEIRIRLILRPDEGAPGTRVDIALRHPNRDVLFSGFTELDPQRGWPFETELQILPVATFEVGDGMLLAVGQSIQLDELTPIIFSHGVASSAHDIDWASTDPSALEVAGGRATARSPGAAGVVGVWNGQTDTLAVDVFPSGTIVAPSSVRYFLGPSDLIADTLPVENGIVGDVGPLQVTVDPAFPWLSAQLTSSLAPTSVAIQVSGPLLPEYGSVGEVVISSSFQGVANALVTVDARGEPWSGVDSVRWNPFCVDGDSLAVPRPGVVACMDLRARAWREGDLTRVVVEAENLLGSRGDSLDTADQFDLTGFGVGVPSITVPIELLSVRPNGPVGVTGGPSLRLRVDQGFFGVTGIPHSAVVGCTPSQRVSASFITCDPQGLTGSVRADFQVPDTAWALTSAFGSFEGVMIPGTAFSCGSGRPSTLCLLR